MTILNGILLVDKESGVTSHDVVDDLRRLLKIQAVGHAGTLDPLATGLLICMVGEATKLSQYVMSEEKSYRVGIKFGIETDSGDITGRVLKERPAVHITREMIQDQLNGLVGCLQLAVPKYSAVKVEGRKLYEYARAQEAVEIPTKAMTIHEVTLLEFAPGQISVDLRCEKGTYVRSWVSRLGDLLGVGATVSSLRRLSSGDFSVGESRTVKDWESDPLDLEKSLVPMKDVLRGWPLLRVVQRDEKLIKNGQLPRGVGQQISQIQIKQGVRLINEEGSLLALVTRDESKGIRLARVFKS